MNKSIVDPPIPYVGPICGGNFAPGKLIRIQGTIPDIAYRFNINLQCSPKTTPQDDIAVQVTMHLLDGFVGLNSLQDGVWGEEERELVLPIKHEEDFELTLLCDFSRYKMMINGRHYYEFPQRIHYDRISHLAIDGDVSIKYISYESATSSSLTPSAAMQDDPPPPFYNAIISDIQRTSLNLYPLGIPYSSPSPKMGSHVPLNLTNVSGMLTPYASDVPENFGMLHNSRASRTPSSLPEISVPLKRASFPIEHNSLEKCPALRYCLMAVCTVLFAIAVVILIIVLIIICNI